jgi:hypothetical protein
MFPGFKDMEGVSGWRGARRFMGTHGSLIALPHLLLELVSFRLD